MIFQPIVFLMQLKLICNRGVSNSFVQTSTSSLNCVFIDSHPPVKIKHTLLYIKTSNFCDLVTFADLANMWRGSHGSIWPSKEVFQDNVNLSFRCWRGLFLLAGGLSSSQVPPLNIYEGCSIVYISSLHTSLLLKCRWHLDARLVTFVCTSCHDKS